MRFHVLLLMLIAGVTGCVTNSVSSQDPTQLGTRQIEVRTLDAPQNIAYNAAMQAFFSLGYSINHTDKDSGVITGSRTTGTKEAKDSQKTKSILGFVPYVGMASWLLPDKEPTAHQVTMLLQSVSPNRTQIRFKMQANGEAVWDSIAVDKLWVTTQREAMLESGITSKTPVVKNEKEEESQR